MDRKVEFFQRLRQPFEFTSLFCFSAARSLWNSLGVSKKPLLPVKNSRDG